tara:strand:- start:64 stop:192 length:129 start_codon:yes stop_codon:yes gene_type:complete
MVAVVQVLLLLEQLIPVAVVELELMELVLPLQEMILLTVVQA